MILNLDYNATTPLNADVLEEMVFTFQNNYGNASSNHVIGQKAYEIVENARAAVADLIDISTLGVVFTSGATESNNMAILGLETYARQTGKCHIISTAIEHSAILKPLQILSKRGFKIDLIKPHKRTGCIEANELLDKITNKTCLVSVMHANNETGAIQPVKQIGEILKNTEVYFHIDAAQTFGKLVKEIKNLNYDLMSVSGHKMYGPQGIGALIITFNEKKPHLSPIMFGGEQERGLRPGTSPIALIAGFGKACNLAESEYETNNIIYLNNKKLIFEALNKIKCEYKINGESDSCMPNTMNISICNIIATDLIRAASHIACFSIGSACNCNNESGSHILEAMGLSDDRIKSAIRLSWGNQPLDKDKLIQFAKIIKDMQINA